MRWNFAFFGGDIALFSLGLSISSSYTILPLFVAHLTRSNVAVALIPAIRALGLYGPQLLVAALVERLRHALPFILLATILERVPYLVLAFGAIALAGRNAGALLALFFAMIFLALFAGGITYPAWLDMIARSIPRTWLGRFMGFWWGAGNVLGIGGAAIATVLLASVSWPLNFALCFAMTFAAMAISFVLLALGREPARVTHTSPHPPAARLSMSAQAREIVALVRQDGALRRLLIANGLVGMSTMAGALYAVSAVRLGGLSDPEVGAESTVLFVAMTVGSFAWGAIGDRFGHRATLLWGTACAGIAGLAALVAHGFLAYGVVFLALGLSISGVLLAGFTLITEFGPEERRPTYVALASVAYAPFVIGAPILGGFMANAWGYPPVFAVTALFATAAALMLRFWVPDPRMKSITSSESA
ncbi:MAG TPA: MFS transporter [Ktedonobacterales bacterium]|jgi:MFS family permease|nr:MFS transporter [Ktedonobacterales bacterium]